VPDRVAAGLALVWRHRLLAALYAACMVCVCRAGRERAWVDAWVVLAFGLIVFLLGRWYPWYLVWPLVPAAAASDRLAAPATMAGCVLGGVLMWRYTLVW
jgi:hypothetical protein